MSDQATKLLISPAKGVFVQGFDADAWCQKHGYYNGTQTIADSVEHDLAQLQLPYVDLLLLHWPCGTVAQTVAAYTQLEPFVRSGQARAIGVSNMNASMLDAVIKGSTIPPAAYGSPPATPTFFIFLPSFAAMWTDGALPMLCP